jgi:hypothetical protein
MQRRDGTESKTRVKHLSDAAQYPSSYVVNAQLPINETRIKHGR